MFLSVTLQAADIKMSRSITVHLTKNLVLSLMIEIELTANEKTVNVQALKRSLINRIDIEIGNIVGMV